MAPVAQITQSLTEFISQSSFPIIDLRVSDEFIRGHIAGSANFPFLSVFTRLHEITPREQAIRLVVGCVESQRVADKLRKKGYDLTAIIEWSPQIELNARKQGCLQQGRSLIRLWRPASIVEAFVERYSHLVKSKNNSTFILALRLAD